MSEQEKLGGLITVLWIITAYYPDNIKWQGEVSYSNEVAKQLEKLVNSVKNAITEITVINYTEKVA